MPSSLFQSLNDAYRQRVQQAQQQPDPVDLPELPEVPAKRTGFFSAVNPAPAQNTGGLLGAMPQNAPQVEPDDPNTGNTALSVPSLYRDRQGDNTKNRTQPIEKAPGSSWGNNAMMALEKKETDELQYNIDAAQKELDDAQKKVMDMGFTEDTDEMARRNSIIANAQAKLDLAKKAQDDAKKAEIDAKNSAIYEKDIAELNALPVEVRKAIGDWALAFSAKDADLRHIAENQAKQAVKDAGLDLSYQRMAELAESESRRLNAEANAKMDAWIDDTVSGSVPGAVGLNVAARGANVLGGPLATAEGISTIISDALGLSRYRGGDPNAPGNSFSRFADKTTEATANQIESPTGKLLYKGAVGLADNLNRLLISRKVNGLGIFGKVPAESMKSVMSGTLTQAGFSTWGNSFQKGMNETGDSVKSAFLATLDTMWEIGTESVGLERLLNMDVSGGAMAVAKNVFKQTGVEVTEDLLSQAGQLLDDAIVAGSQSKYESMRLGLIEKGVSAEDASRQVMWAVGNEMYETMITSAIAAVGMTGTTAASGVMSNTMETLNDQLNIGEGMYDIPTTPRTGFLANQNLSDDLSVDPQNAASVEQAQQDAEPVNKGGSTVSDVLDLVDNNGGKATNSMAEMIWNDAGAVEQLSQATGIELSAEKTAYNRGQIKAALELLNENANGNQEGMAEVLMNEDEEGPDLVDENEVPTNTIKDYGGVSNAIAEASSIFRKTGAVPKWAVNAIRNSQVAIQQLEEMSGRNIPTKPSRVTEAIRSMIADINSQFADTSEQTQDITETENQVPVDEGQQILDSLNEAYAARVREANGIEAQQNQQEAQAETEQQGQQEQEEQPSTENQEQQSEEQQEEQEQPVAPPKKNTNRPEPGTPRSASAAALMNEARALNALDQQSGQEQNLNGEQENQGEQQDNSIPERDLVYHRADRAARDQQIEDSGAQPKRPNSARPVRVANQDSEGNPISKSASNLQTSSLLTMDAARTVELLAARGELSYVREGNVDTIQKAAAELQKSGNMLGELSGIKRSAAKGSVSSMNIAKASLIFAHAQDVMNQYSGDKTSTQYIEARNVLAETTTVMSMLAKNAGQSTQFFNVFRNIPSDVQAQSLKSDIVAAIDNLTRRSQIKRGPDGMPVDIVFNEEQFQKYQDACDALKNAKTADAIQQAKAEIAATQKQIYEDAVSQLDVSFYAKLNAYRYANMLGRFKTQAGNIMGNAFAMPVEFTNNLLKTLTESIYYGDDRSHRTTTVYNPFNQEDMAMRSWAKQFAKSEEIQTILANQGAKTESAGSAIGDMLTENIFSRDIENPAAKAVVRFTMDGFRNAVNWGLSKGDMIFKTPYFANDLGHFLRSRGYTVQDIQSGAVSQETMAEATDHAIQHALHATYNDNSKLANLICNLQYTGSYEGAEGFFGHVWNDLILGTNVPFKKVTANVVKYTTELSPTNFFKGIWEMQKSVANQEATAEQAIEHFTRGLTGSGTIVAGMMLASGALGFIRITGKRLSDDEKAAGYKPYSMNIIGEDGVTAFTLGNGGPGVTGILLGANLMDAINGKGYSDDSSVLAKFATVFTESFDPLIQMSFLENINNLLKTGDKYGEASDPNNPNALMRLAAESTANFIKQLIPAPLRSAYDVAHPNKRANYNTASDAWDKIFQGVEADIPFVNDLLGRKTDTIDAFGRTTEKPENLLARFLSEEVSPSKITSTDNDPLTDEIQRLGTAMNKSFMPTDAPKKITYTDKDGVEQTHTFSAEDWEKFARDRGSLKYTLASEAIKSDIYQELDDKERGQLLHDIYSYADAMSLRKALPDIPYNADSWEYGINKDNPLQSMLDRRRQLASGLGKESYNDAVAAGFNLNQMHQLDAVMNMSDIVFNALHKNWTKGGNLRLGSSLDTVMEYYNLLDDSQKAFFDEHAGNAFKNYAAARAAGISNETYQGLYRQYRKMDPNEKASVNAEKWSYILGQAQDDGKITKDQRKVLSDGMKFYTIIPQEAELYNKIDGANVSAKSARIFTEAIHALTPPDGKKSVAVWQKYLAIATADSVTDDEKREAVYAIMSETSHRMHLNDMLNAGYTVEDFARAYQAYSQASTADAKKAALKAAGYGDDVLKIFKRTT